MKKPSVKRTFVKSIYAVTMYDRETKQNVTEERELPAGEYTLKQVANRLKKSIDTDRYTVIDHAFLRYEQETYMLSVEDFIKYATKIDKVEDESAEE